jgi:nucleoside-diphosphate-sugar epimerase
MIYEECGEDAKVAAVGSRVAKAVGLFWPLAREGAEMVYQFERPFVVDSGKYASAFDASDATPYREGIRRTLDWYRRDDPSGVSPRVSTVAHHVRPEQAATRR